jgi:HEAT repeat protein
VKPAPGDNLWAPYRPTAQALAEGSRSLVVLLRSDQRPQRIRACQTLEAIAALRARLLRMAGDPAALAKALGAQEDPLLAGLKEGMADLTRCVGRDDVEERLAALYVLEELGPEAADAVAAASNALTAADPFVRWAAARVLGKVAPKKPILVVAALAKKVADKNGDVRITVLAALERYGPDAIGAVKEVSQQALKGRDEQTRLWAVRVLAAIGPKGREKTTAPLIEALKAKEVGIRRIAVRALSGFGKPGADTAEDLRAALKDDDAEVRRMASEALLAE